MIWTAAPSLGVTPSGTWSNVASTPAALGWGKRCRQQQGKDPLERLLLPLSRQPSRVRHSPWADRGHLRTPFETRGEADTIGDFRTPARLVAQLS